MDDDDLAVPPARRQGRRRWTDPRLVVGLLVVTGSVVLGSRVVASADDTVDVWAVRDGVRAGDPVSASDLEPVGVLLDDETRDRYVPAAEQPPTDAAWSHDVDAGELVSRSAMLPADETDTVELPLAVRTSGAPADLAVGDVVDVWASPDAAGTSATSGGDEEISADLALDDVVVESVDADGGVVADVRGVVVRVPADLDALGDRIAVLARSTVTLVRVEG